MLLQFSQFCHHRHRRHVTVIPDVSVTSNRHCHYRNHMLLDLTHFFLYAALSKAAAQTSEPPL